MAALVAVASVTVLRSTARAGPTTASTDWSSPTTAPALTAATATSPLAPATMPAGRFDDTEVRRSDTASASNAGGSSKSADIPGYDAPRVVVALAAVVALIFALRWLSRKFMLLPNAQARTGVVQVLARQVLTPKQQLVVVKIGRRVVVAADNGSQLNALTEITDADEVASLIGQLREEKTGSRSGSPSFAPLFSRLKQRFGAPADDSAAPDEDEFEGESVEEAADHLQDGHPTSEAQLVVSRVEQPDGTSVAVAREELNGLLRKVRMVSDQFSQS